MPNSRKPSIGAIFLTIFLDLVGFGLVLPFLAEEARDTFHSTPFVATLLSASYSFMGFLFVPVWGRISDRFGRRPVLLWSIAATMISNAGLGLSLGFGHTIAWLFLTRMFSGIATANISTASAYITDVTKPEDRAKGMGLIGLAFGMGFILGPGIGGLLAPIAVGGRHGPVACFVGAALSLVNLIWAYFGLAESLPKENRTPHYDEGSLQYRTNARGHTERPQRRFDFAAIRKTLADPMLARCVLVNFVLVTSFANLDQTYRFFHKDLFHMNERETGVLFAVIGIAAALVQGLLVRRLSGKVRDESMMRWGVALQAIAFAGTAIAPSLGRWMLYVAGIILAFGNGLSQPAVSSFVSKRALPHERGAILGTNQSFASLARVVGPAMGGWLYGSALGRASPYWAAAIGMVVTFILALSLRSEAPAHHQSTSTQTS